MNTRTVAILCIVSAALAFLIAFFGPRLLDKNKTRFAVVDLSRIIRKQQERSVRLLADPASDDAAKKTAVASASDFGKKVNAEVTALSQECGCVLLMREAIVAGHIEDLTPRLLARLNIQ